MDHVLFQAHPEIQSHRPILSVIQRSRQIDAVFPHGIIATHVHHTVIIFSHQVQSVQCLCPETVALSVETVVGAEGKAMVIIEIQTIKLDDGSMDAQCSPALEGEMLGGGQVEAGEMIGILANVVECDISTSMVRMTAWIVCSQHNLWCPLFLPAFFPQAQPSVKRTVLVDEFTPRLLRPTGNAFY